MWFRSGKDDQMLAGLDYFYSLKGLVRHHATLQHFSGPHSCVTSSLCSSGISTSHLQNSVVIILDVVSLEAHYFK